MLSVQERREEASVGSPSSTVHASTRRPRTMLPGRACARATEGGVHYCHLSSLSGLFWFIMPLPPELRLFLSELCDVLFPWGYLERLRAF